MGWIHDAYEWEGDKDQKLGSYRYRSRVSLREGEVRLSCARIYFKSQERIDYAALLAAQLDVIKYNNDKIAEGIVGGGPGGYGFATYPVAGDPLETVPTVPAYAGDDLLIFRYFAGWEDEYLEDQATQYDLSGGNGSMAGITQPMTTRNVILTITKSALLSEITITVTGVLPNGDADTETFTEDSRIDDNGVIEGTVAWREITSIVVTDIEGHGVGDTLDLGYGTLRFSKEVYDRKPFKFPSNVRTSRFMIEAEGNVDVQDIEVASSIMEMMTVDQ